MNDEIETDYLEQYWNMVNINGNWFHVDVAADDPIWQEKTSLHNVNNDNIDEGYVSHTYFLKSDDEYEKLGHYSTEEGSLSASFSNVFDAYIFNNVDVAFNYIDGSWYYLDTNTRNVVYKANIDRYRKNNDKSGK